MGLTGVDYSYIATGGFQGGGSFDFQPYWPFVDPVPPGEPYSLLIGGTQYTDPDMSAGHAPMFGATFSNLSGPGVFSTPFQMEETYFNAQTTCPITICPILGVEGFGILTVTAIPYPGFPGLLQLEDPKFVFTTPEPSTASLLVLGFAGLAALGRRRQRVLGPRPGRGEI